jgi:hypothetical protein
MSETQWAKNIPSWETTKVGVFTNSPSIDVSINEILLSFMDIIASKGYRYVCHSENCPIIIMSNHIIELSREDVELVEDAATNRAYAPLRLMDGSEVEVYKESV